MILKGPNWRVLGAKNDNMFIDIAATSCALYGFRIEFNDSRRTNNTASNRKSPKSPVNSIINDLINAINRK